MVVLRGRGFRTRLILSLAALCLSACTTPPDEVAGDAETAADAATAADAGSADAGSSADSGGAAGDAGSGVDAAPDVAAASDTGKAADTQPVAGACKADGDCPAADDPCNPNRCVAGTCKAVAVSGGGCDDGEPCTLGDLCKQGACNPGPNTCQCGTDQDCLGKEDGDACNGTMFCDTGAVPHVCAVNPATVVNCDSSEDSQCAVNKCAPETGKCVQVPRPDGTACNDGDVCTVESSCAKGACVAGKASWCECESDAACQKYDDGDLCTGTLYCDLTTFPYACKVNKASVVTCSSDNDTTCAKNQCDGVTGKCAPSAVKDGTDCDDGDGSTLEDKCVAGVCSGGISTSLCKKNADCKDDGDLCNGVPYCHVATSTCKANPATVITCPSSGDTACLKNTCVPATGECAPKNTINGTPCDDGDACSEGDICLQGTCGGQNICICKDDPDCLGKDDGNQCNGLPFCNKATGKCEFNPNSVVVCKSVADTDCVKNACIPLSGACTPTAVERATLETCKTGKGAQTPACRWQQIGDQEPDTETVKCNDGDACTTGEICKKAVCGGGTFVCACKGDADCVDQDDGDKCNGLQFCNLGKTPAICETNPATVIKCKTVGDTACRKNTCEPKIGKCLMVPAVAGIECDDGSQCTAGDYCDQGNCQAGANTCECEKAADCQGKEDGDACNGTLYCDKTGEAPKCKLNLASVVTCPTAADTACAKAQCLKSSGKCVLGPAPDGTACDDGDGCSVSDICLGGACLAGPATSCNDNDPCTLDKCNPVSGCKHPPNTGSCDADGDGCTDDTCKAGTCVVGPKLDCDDANACTLDGCSAKKGACTHSSKPDGAPCDDGSPCTGGDRCESGSCKAGGKAPDGTPCKSGFVCFDNVCGVEIPAGTVAVPAGTFWMGCNPTTETQLLACKAYEKPYHEAWLSAFFMDRTQVTVAAYAKCVQAGDCQPPQCVDKGEDAKNTWGKEGKEGYPVGCVAPGQAAAFCQWVRPGGRLPREAEWEKAARGGCEKYPGEDCAKAMPLFPWGNLLPGASLVNVTAAVMPAVSFFGGMSPYGILNMTGNGMHWLADTFSEVAYANASYVDPVHTAAASEFSVRGSRWGPQQPWEHRTSHRNGLKAYLFPEFTFRCVSPMGCSPSKPSQCDDGSGCTIDACKGAAGCTHVVQAGSCDVDGSPCTPDECSEGKCIAKPSLCDDKDPCTADLCDFKTAKCSHVAAADGDPCDDGDPCVINEVCQAGKCNGKAKVCGGVQEVCVAGACKGPPEPMILIPAGHFYMGCNAKLDKQCIAQEKPQHKVELSAYYIDKHEVTVERYKVCVDKGKCATPSSNNDSCNWGKKGQDKHPVNCIQPAMAQKYCATMIPDGRLPTEAEWERAARGGCELHAGKVCADVMPTYPWGEAAPACPLATIRVGGADICGTGWYLSAPVGAVPQSKSPYGLLDVTGNVNELVGDTWDESFYAKSPAKDPFKAPPPKGYYQHVVRGGAAKTSAIVYRVSYRAAANPGHPSIGFRCARPAK